MFLRNPVQTRLPLRASFVRKNVLMRRTSDALLLAQSNYNLFDFIDGNLILPPVIQLYGKGSAK
jgi:hypothetical protein